MKRQPSIIPMVFPTIELSDGLEMPGFTLHAGEVLQLVAAEEVQEELIADWLIVQDKGYQIQGLGKQVGFVLNGLGLIANLTIKENIMLTQLYHKTRQPDSVMAKLEALIKETQLDEILEQGAGLRSARVNSEVSLCRCVLQQARYIIMQQPQSSMSKNEAREFTTLMLKVVSDLHAGVVYMTASADDCGGLSADYQVNLARQEKVS